MVFEHARKTGTCRRAFRVIGFKKPNSKTLEFLNQKYFESGWYNDLRLAKVALSLGAEINASDGIGATPLMWFSIHGNLDAVKFLVENGVFVNAVSNYGWTALMHACFRGSVEVAEHLILNHAKLESCLDGLTLMTLAYHSNNRNMIELLKLHGL